MHNIDVKPHDKEKNDLDCKMTFKENLQRTEFKQLEWNHYMWVKTFDKNKLK